MKIVDLSMPIETDHLRWAVDRGVSGNHTNGDLFEATWLRTPCHGFTHMDAPRHMVPGGPTTDALDLAKIVGRAAVINLRDTPPDTAIDAARLAERGEHLAAGEIALLSTGWDRHADWHDAAFWKTAPWLTRDAAEWLLARGPTAVAVDFPQDWPIRRLLDGEVVKPISEHVTHDVLLRAGVILIEYLVGTAALDGPHTFLCALPLKLPGADGAPARVVALEGLTP